ncbi:MAG: hypothetical protein O7A09_07620 [Proteobacteria bacterium]|nr:hypothetical protein [Pseudomonadota bacterium]
MSEGRGHRYYFFRRWRYLVDPGLQLTLALQMAAVLLVVAAAYALAVYGLFDEASLQALTAEETRSLFMRANLLYGGQALIFVIAVAVLLLHRIAGPAQLVERAVRGMLDGEYDHRLALRPRDGLKPLASAVAELRAHLCEREERREALLKELADHLAADDVAAARELLRRESEPALPGSTAKAP